jgi:hypothetical protein
MKDSLKLIEQACNGIRPERTPIFDLYRNDRVIEHFAGRRLDGSDNENTAILAAANGLDGTRQIITPFKVGQTWTDDMGNIRQAQRWMSWVIKNARNSTGEWVEWIKKEIERIESTPQPTQLQIQQEKQRQLAYNNLLKGTVNIFCTPETGFNRIIFGCQCGLKHFSFLWYDHRNIVMRWIKAIEKQQLDYIRLTAIRETSPLVMIYSDIAYNQGLMFSTDHFRQMGLLEHVEQICHCCHKKDMKVIFHSDGNVTEIIDGLVDAGIDGFNPIDVAAGMDSYLLRKKYPELILVGGLDVKSLLLNGTVDQIRAETRRLIENTGRQGRLLIGCTAEVAANIPLDNYLAFHDEAMTG